MNSNPLWKQCVEWLVTVGVLQPNHRARFANAVVFDLAQTLRDGVVLCNLLNTLQPGIIDEGQINLRPQMSEFLCMQNIRVVIYILRTAFAISPMELFEPEDLYQMTNFEKVLNVLSYVSHLPLAALKYKAFPQDRRRQTDRRLRATEEEDIYKNLPDLATERALADEDDNLYDSVPEEKEEGIYGSLIAVQKAAQTMSVRDKRGCCIHEIVETESNYVQHLDMMVNEFIEPLRRSRKMSEKDIKIIFINIEQLRPIHKSFLDELLMLQKEGTNAPFTQPFLRHQDDLLIYGEYCSNLVDAQDHLEELTKCDEGLRVVIEECQIKSSRNKFKLRELLCVPMQRILKYQLLVKELNKHTPEGHIDKPNFQSALTAMQEISHYINEVKRDSEELIKINQIETRLSEYYARIPLRNYGRVRKDGELKVKFSDDNKQALRYAFLFDQALFMTKLKNDTYILKDLVRLDDMKLDDISNLKSNKWAWTFSLTSPSQNAGSFVLYAKTSAEKIKWMEAFKDALDNICPRALKGKKQNFEMHTFSEPSTCSHCNLLLKGIFFQGYRCTVSNAQCHKNCLVETLRLIESNSLKPQQQRGESNKPPPVPDRGRKKIDHHQLNQCAIPTPQPLNYKAHRMYDGNPVPPFQNANIITFNIGELIQVLDQVTPDWWKGKSMSNFDQIGYFPASFVSPQSRARTQRKDNYLASNPALRDSPSSTSPAQSNMDGPIEEADWYAGPVDRGETEKLLWDKPTGTFLVRKKDQGHAISLKYNKDVKHIKIHRADGMHYVAECKNFRSVQDLVRFYQENSLSGFFLGLETTLRYPYRDPVMFPGMLPTYQPRSPLTKRNGFPARADTQKSHPSVINTREIIVEGRKYEVIGIAQAIYDFDPRSQQELPLRAGQVVHIISKAGGSHGWWKGEYNGKIGYFPITFVEEQAA